MDCFHALAGLFLVSYPSRSWILHILNSHNSMLYNSLRTLLHVFRSRVKIPKMHNFSDHRIQIILQTNMSRTLPTRLWGRSDNPCFEFWGHYLSEWRWPSLYHSTKPTPPTYSDTFKVLAELRLSRRHQPPRAHSSLRQCCPRNISKRPMPPIFREYEFCILCTRTCQ